MDIMTEVKNGASILLRLRSLKEARRRKARRSNWRELCESFGLCAERMQDTRVYELRRTLTELRRLGLARYDGDDGNRPIPGPITITERWTAIQTALGGPPLRDIAAVCDRQAAMAVRPLHGRPEAPKPPVDVFVLMPFADQMKPIYDDHIKPVVKRLRAKVGRADERLNEGHVMAEVWRDIVHARVIVADCTKRNANVFYEIGLAHAVGKPVVLITQDLSDIPFDLRAMRYIRYRYTPPGMRKLEHELEAMLRNALEAEARG